MRIAWFTPFCRKSSIGRRSAEIVAELRTRADVDVWCPDAPDPWETAAPVITFRDADSTVLQRLKTYDLCVYNMGNYAPYHAHIAQVSQAHPGVVVLHDYVMLHFYSEYAQRHGAGADTIRFLLDKHYGPGAGKMAGNPRLYEPETAIKYPLCEEAVSGSLAAVVHSDYVARRIESLGLLPVQKLALPCEPLGGVPASSRQQLGLSENDFVIVSAGHVNRNKRVHAVLEAIGSTPALKAAAKYVVVGPSDPGYQLELDKLIQSYGLQERVLFTGYVSDEVLEGYLSHADVCVNLRHPSLEGASGSALEQMLHGKPLIVSRSGWFDELPDEIVIKVKPSDEVNGVRAGLSQLIGNPDRRRELGEAGRSYVRTHCTPQLYAEGFLAFARQVRRYAPLLGLADRLAVALNSLGIDGESGIVGTAADECAKLFGGSGTGYESES